MRSDFIMGFIILLLSYATVGFGIKMKMYGDENRRLNAVVDSLDNVIMEYKNAYTEAVRRIKELEKEIDSIGNVKPFDFDTTNLDTIAKELEKRIKRK